MQLLPFFLSALLFLSALFTVFSPLPLMLIAIRGKTKFIVLAFLTNLVWVTLGAGWVSTGFYFSMIGVIGLALPQFLLRGWSLEKSMLYSFGWMLVGLLFFGVIYWQVTGILPWVGIQEQVSFVVDQLNQNNQLPSGPSSQLPIEVLKKNIWIEMPSALAIFCLIAIWINITLFIRLGAPETHEKISFKLTDFKNWKAPDFLIWPTILAGASLLNDFGLTSNIGVNVFKFLMAIYALQGLAILGYFFDHFGIKGIFRSLLILFIVLLMMPLLLAIGFFDLWFDFRKKLRQSKEGS